MSETLYDDSSSTEDVDYFASPFGQGPLAQSFNSGTSPVTLNVLALDLADVTPNDGGTLTVELFSDAGGAPGAEIAQLGTVDDADLASTSTNTSITIDTPPTLDANTQYWIEVVGTAATNATWAATQTPSGTGVNGQSANIGGNADGADNMIMTAEGSLCFAAGTRILTARGEVPVETLRPGDMAMAVRAGGLRRVEWIGHRHINLRGHPRPETANPIRICADAIAPGRPHADLLLSPNHAVFIDGHLIAARYLLNGATIRQESWPDVRYFHVELASHDILLANGLPAESFLDVGNRGAFANGGGALTLHPEFDRQIWEIDACAPALDKGTALECLRLALLDRARQLGHERTADPGLRVVLNGRTIAPDCAEGALRFDLPEATGHIRLVSRTARPWEMRALHPDTRTLGVGITHLALNDEVVALTDARLLSGWHDAEPALRWTNGDASLDTGGARTLTLRLHPDMDYWDIGTPEARPCSLTACG